MRLMPKTKKTFAQIAQEAPAEHDAIEMLRKTCAGSGQLVLAQVRNGTGSVRQTRTADALVFETWQSRGMGITGVEYKKYRHDWLKELKDPAKAEEIGKYCKQWLILAPAGLVQPEELPDTWGLWEIKGKRIFRTVKPPVREFIAPTINFVCSILRANQANDPHYDMIVQARKDAADELEKHHKAEVERVRENYRSMRESVEKFEKETGLSLSKWSVEDSIKAAPLLLRYMKNPEFIDGTLDKARQQLVDTIARIDEIKGTDDADNN